MPVTVVLLDQSRWLLDYDSYGNIISIVYPYGGSASYQWQEIAMPYCNDGIITPVSRAVKSRTLFDGTNSRTWQYNWGQRQSDGTITNTVTDPAGNDTAHVFSPVIPVIPCSFYETETRYYQGSQASGPLLKTVDTVYTGSAGVLNRDSHQCGAQNHHHHAAQWQSQPGDEAIRFWHSQHLTDIVRGHHLRRCDARNGDQPGAKERPGRSSSRPPPPTSGNRTRTT